MSFQVPRINYTGRIKEVVIGSGPKAVKIGGETCYPFYLFEGEMPNPPKIAFEVWDYAPEDWPEWAIEPYRDVIADPVAWAKKSVDVYGAEMIALLLEKRRPERHESGRGRGRRDGEGGLDAVAVPLIVWGTANDERTR